MPSRAEELRQARAHVAQARSCIEDQTALIERLRSDGHDTEAAERLLAVFIDVMGKLSLHQEELERREEARARDGAASSPA